jgi:hydroxymethylbilane synthase
LPAGARIGTGSPRRAGQLAALGRDFDVVPVRGNVDTRLGLVTERALDAVVLARAGLARLGRLDAVTEVIEPRHLMPAPGQGALAVEARGADAATVAILGRLDHPATRAAVTAERALLAALEAGCSAPVGAFAEVLELDRTPEIHLCAVVITADGRAGVRLSATGPVDDAGGVGRRLAAELVAHGAADLMGEHVS